MQGDLSTFGKRATSGHSAATFLVQQRDVTFLEFAPSWPTDVTPFDRRGAGRPDRMPAGGIRAAMHRTFGKLVGNRKGTHKPGQGWKTLPSKRKRSDAWLSLPKREDLPEELSDASMRRWESIQWDGP